MKLPVAARLERAISAVCREAGLSPRSSRSWESRTESDLAYDLAVCLASSQTRYEYAEAMGGVLKNAGLLDWKRPALTEARLYRALAQTLSRKHEVRCGQRVVQARIRFPLHTALHIAKTAMHLRSRGTWLRGILRQAESPRAARMALIDHVIGFGPKQASLFLRRVGYSAQLAVLDRHVIEYLRVCHMYEVAPGTLAHLPSYEGVEAYFTSVARTQRVEVGRLDLAIWVTMRVAREEGLV